MQKLSLEKYLKRLSFAKKVHPNLFPQLKKCSKFVFITFASLVTIGLLLPQNFVIPVQNAVKGNWDDETFWYYPWGQSIVHKGVDIFAAEGTPVLSATEGVVVSVEKTGNGGNVIYVLGPKWRLHYYAHLQSVETYFGAYVHTGAIVGKVGNTGNAATTPPHLHYSIQTLVPYPWRWDSDVMGWKKMFYLNPTDYLNEKWHFLKQQERQAVFMALEK